MFKRRKTKSLIAEELSAPICRKCKIDYLNDEGVLDFFLPFNFCELFEVSICDDIRYSTLFEYMWYHNYCCSNRQEYLQALYDCLNDDNNKEIIDAIRRKAGVKN